MSETTNTLTTTGSDLDRLADRVELAAALIVRLREERAQFERERNELATRLQGLEHTLQGHDAADLLTEVTALKREQRDWVSERRDVASRIEALIRKLERLDS